MSEKRFTIHKESKYKEEWHAYPFCIKEDGEVVLETIPLSIAEKVRDKLNGQQERIKELENEKVELMEDCACQYKQIQKLESENEDLQEVNKENQLLHEENVKQCERWRSLYELKDSEVTARVDTLNRVCNYYLTESRFKGDTDPNEAVKEVINEILNAPIYEE